MKIGFVGLGIMGLPMAGHLVAAGHELQVTSRTPKVLEGAVTVVNAAEAARGAEIVITMVPDTPDVEQVLFGEGGIVEMAAPGTVVIDMSTISARATMGFAARLAEKGVLLLDAPVSGGDVGAKNATLSIMVGGEKAAYEKALPVLQKLGRNVVYVGGSGAGQKTKSVNQVVGALNLLAAVEGVRLAKAAGLDAESTLSAVGGGAAGSWMWANLGPKIAAGDGKPGFMIRLQQKDLRLARELFEEMGMDAPGTELTYSLFSKAVEQGLGAEGNQALFRLWE